MTGAQGGTASSIHIRLQLPPLEQYPTGMAPVRWSAWGPSNVGKVQHLSVGRCAAPMLNAGCYSLLVSPIYTVYACLYTKEPHSAWSTCPIRSMSLTSLARVNACLAACQYNQNNPIRLMISDEKHGKVCTPPTPCLQSFWALLCICICLPSDVNAKKACDRRPWIPLAKYCPLWLQPFHLQLHFSDGRFFSPSWLPSHAWAIGRRSLNNLQSWRLPCETFRFTSFTSTIISWSLLHAIPGICNMYIYHIYSYLI